METVLITGAARRLGSHIAECLASDGCFVWIHYRNHEADAHTLCNRIIAAGGFADCVSCDLSQTNEIDAMIEKIIASSSGGLTTLINNASVFPHKTLSQTNTDDWDMVMNTNLKAIWYLSQSFRNKFSSAKRIISIGDANIAKGMNQHAVYALSKHALKYLTEQLAAEYSPTIRVNTLSPGLVLQGDSEPDYLWEKRQESALTDNSRILSEIMEGIRFLMRDPGMTGAELIIDNGVHLYGKNKIMK